MTDIYIASLVTSLVLVITVLTVPIWTRWLERYFDWLENWLDSRDSSQPQQVVHSSQPHPLDQGCAEPAILIHALEAQRQQLKEEALREEAAAWAREQREYKEQACPPSTN